MFCIATIFMKYCYTTGNWLLLLLSEFTGCSPLGENCCETGLLEPTLNSRSDEGLTFDVRGPSYSASTAKIMDADALVPCVDKTSAPMIVTK